MGMITIVIGDNNRYNDKHGDDWGMVDGKHTSKW